MTLWLIWRFVGWIYPSNGTTYMGTLLPFLLIRLLDLSLSRWGFYYQILTSGLLNPLLSAVVATSCPLSNYIKLPSYWLLKNLPQHYRVCYSSLSRTVSSRIQIYSSHIHAPSSTSLNWVYQHSHTYLVLTNSCTDQQPTSLHVVKMMMNPWWWCRFYEPVVQYTTCWSPFLCLKRCQWEYVDNRIFYYYIRFLPDWQI